MKILGLKGVNNENKTKIIFIYTYINYNMFSMSIINLIDTSVYIDMF